LKGIARVYDKHGKLVATATGRAGRAEVAALAQSLLKSLGPSTGLTPVAREASLGELRPYLRAARLEQWGDLRAAASALAAADRSTAARVPSAKEIADALWRDATIPVGARMIAALAAGEAKEALRLADGDPKDPDVLARRVQAQVALDDLAGAEQTLKTAKGAAPSSPLQLARAQLLFARGKKAAAEKELAPLLDGDTPDAPALAYVASLPSGALGDSTEKLVLGSARRAVKVLPEVASRVGLRAARGGRAGDDVYDLLGVDEVATSDLPEAEKIATAEPEGGTLSQDLKQRRATPVGEPEVVVAIVETHAPDGTPVDPTPKPTARRPTTPPADQRELAIIQPLLAAFDPLESGTQDRSIAIYPAPEEPVWKFWSLWATQQPALGGMLARTVASPPLLMVPNERADEVADPSKDALQRLAKRDRVDFVLRYRVRNEGTRAHVWLIMLDARAGEVYEFDDIVDGAGLVRFNRTLVPIAAVLLIVLIVVGWRRLYNVGEVKVEVRRDPGAERESMVLLLSKKDKAPPIADVAAFHAAMRARGHSLHRLRAMNAHEHTVFPRVPAGSWWVHLYGTYEKGNEVREVPRGLSKQITVGRGDVIPVELDVDPNLSEYRIRILENGNAVAAAVVYVDDNEAVALRTDAGGSITLNVAPGKHVVHCKAANEEFSVEVEAAGSKVHALVLDLTRLRRERELASGVEISSPSASQQVQLRASSKPQGKPAKARADADTVAAPTGLSRYQRVTELGRGAMGIVFRGRDLTLEREVAIKVVSHEIREIPQALEMFIQEAKAMAALNHPNLVTVFDQGVERDEHFIVMELVDGKPLEAVIAERGKLPIKEALSIADQVCAGLAYAHQRRILHRDIKPANIFLAAGGVVKIGDFGLARAVRQARLTQTKVVGTPLYMSPEQIRGSGVDFRSDLYSVGCTLYELLTGQPPFVTGEVMYHHMYTQPAKPSDMRPGLSREIDNLVLSCLEKEMDKRAASADAVREALKPLLSRSYD
jgi:hypothetical protein